MLLRLVSYFGWEGWLLVRVLRLLHLKWLDCGDVLLVAVECRLWGERQERKAHPIVDRVELVERKVGVESFFGVTPRYLRLSLRIVL